MQSIKPGRKTVKMRKAFAVFFPALLAAVCIGAAVFFGLRIYDTCRQDAESERAYGEMAQYVVPCKEPGKTAVPETPAPDGGKPEDAPRILNIDFSALKEASPDLVGWLYCPDTVISYPLVQGKDNSYYLSHLADGSENRNGCLFMDCENRRNMSDENTLVYGHHMASGKMFACLVSYAGQEYYEAHPVVYLVTEEKDYRLELFAGYTAAVDSDAYTLRFASKGDFAAWLVRIKGRSDFSSDVQVGEGDHIVTLSTCAYSFENARYVVHGKLTEN